MLLLKEKHLKLKNSKDFSSELISQIRPDIAGTRKIRINKREVYRKASAIARKFNIKGNYIGLAAGYSPDIYQVFDSSITGSFVNCEKNIHYVNELKSFTRVASWLQNRQLYIYEGNIFDCLVRTSDKFSIVDLDLMTFLATPNKNAIEIVDPIVQSLKNSTSNKFLLIIWSCYGMKVLTEERYNLEVRPTISKKITQKHRILEHLSFKYCDNHIPIKVEIFGLQRRNQKEKENDSSTEGSTNS